MMAPKIAPVNFAAPGGFAFALGRIAACLLLTLQAASAEFWQLSGALKAHDPCLVHDSEKWWLFHTGRGISVKFSSDGHDWQQREPIFAEEKRWWRTFARGMKPDQVWAPDVHHFRNRYWCYYSVSEFGKNDSAIGLTSCSSIDLGDWRDDGMVINSKSGSSSFNAIDPNLTIDAAGDPWLVFGSWFGGIHLVRLDPLTMKPTGRLFRLASRKGGIEGPSLVFANGYYYLFVSIDKCCMGVKSTYKIAYGRSPSITGPYLSKDNKPMLAGGCTVFDAGNERWKGPGGQGICQHQGKWVLARHAYDARNNGVPTLLINDLSWDAEKWPTY
jgi:arabinan endo-1,5-alpha-L-arabinosidase